MAKIYEHEHKCKMYRYIKSNIRQNQGIPKRQLYIEMDRVVRWFDWLMNITVELKSMWRL
jgi:hypothetical protein